MPASFHRRWHMTDDAINKIITATMFEAFQDIAKISEALVAIMEHECCLYGFENEYKLAKKWQRRVDNENNQD